MSVKELEKFTRYFVVKSFQTIVESRLGGERIKTCCNPAGNDWFNLCLNEIKDVNEQTKLCLDSLTCKTLNSSDTGFTIKANWKLCCEISLKTSDGESMTLEYWFIDNGCSEANVASNVTTSSLEIYDVYNRMSLMLKSLITLTRATPAYRISCRQSADSYVICYRVYQMEFAFDEFLRNKTEDETSHFTSEIKLGSIKNKENTLNLTFAYRLNMSKTYQKTSTDELINCPQLLPVKNDHFVNENHEQVVNVKRSVCKQVAAFASPSSDPSLPLLPEAPFASLLSKQSSNQMNDSEAEHENVEVNQNTTSNPIKIPEKLVNTTASPNCSSSADSFVFVELKAPFASDDQSDLGSFFNGPSPTFSASGELSDELSDISNQLAALESNIEQWDSFVDSICCPDNEEDI